MSARGRLSVFGLIVLEGLWMTACGGSGSGTSTTQKTTPTVSAWPTASAITYGQTLASSTLTGGTASVGGTFGWTTSTTAPGAGTPSESVSFTPSDTTDYNTVTGTVSVTVNKATPTVSAWPTASAITFGQTLASSTLTGGTASVGGTFGWTSPTTAPGAGTPSESVTFTPSDTTDYNTVAGPVSVTVSKATPTVSSWPTASAITFGQTLASSTLTGGTASIGGTFGWTTPSTEPAAGTTSESVTFTPSDTTDYNKVEGTVSITVNTSATFTLTVDSFAPASGVAITATPADNNGNGSGSTPFTLTYNTGTTVTLSAPASSGSYTFVSWTGCTTTPGVPTNCTLTISANAAVTATFNQSTSTVTVDESSTGPAVTDQILGVNLAAWYDVVGNASAINPALGQAGIQALRWPGGSWSDQYHWGYQTGSSSLVAAYMCECSSATQCTANSQSWAGYSTFAEFANALPQAGPYDLALTANYGTNEACTGGGDPNEAAAWAAAAVSDGLTVSHMTVGNEEYGSWETDLHNPPNNPTTYAAAVAGAGGYYQAIKAASPNTKVGVVVDAASGWDETVLANAKGFYDFVEYHYYPETPGEENDTTLIQQDAQQLTTNINIIKSELTKWGTPNTPIYVGEIGAPYSNPGKQSWSITQGLYAGQVLGEAMNDGVSRLTWWIGFGNCNGDEGNDSTSLYGWQNFGAYNIFADGSGDTGPNGSPCSYGGPIGTMSPTARAFELFSNVAVNGESALTTSVTGDTTDVVAYAATHSGGTALVLFNRNETTSQPVSIALSGQTTASSATVITYDKAIYDLSGSPSGTPADPAGTSTWAPPTTSTISSPTLPLNLTLAPWSMNVVIIP